ncbi:MAG: hypothetical protein OHK006_13730 [Thermodesulfovibrionales bacterium]
MYDGAFCSIEGTTKAVRGTYMAKELQLSVTDREITPWGGMALMDRLMRTMGFRELLMRSQAGI